MSGPDPVQAWRAVCDRFAALAEETEAAAAADGVRHLARQVVLALEEQLEHSDPRHPSFHRYEEPWRQWGAPNPDNVYVRTAIEPQATYRVWANVSGVREALISLVEGDMHLEEYGVYSERSLTELEVASDGNLELVVSPEPHPGNWLPTHPKARMLMIRQYQYDWTGDPIATFHIERLDTRGVSPPSAEPADLSRALERAATWVERSLRYWSAHSTRETGTPANIARRPKGAHGEHRYSLADFGLDASEQRALFANYCERFGVPAEA